MSVIDEQEQALTEVKNQEQAPEAMPQSPVDTPLTENPTVQIRETPLGRGILEIIREFEQNEESVRHHNTMKWRKHMYYWNSIQYLFESELTSDWMTVNDLKDEPDSDIDPAL